MNALTEPSLMEPRSSHLAASLPAALDRLLSALLERRWTTSASDRLTHGSDESSYLPCPPWGVAYPQSTDEVAQIVHERLIPGIRAARPEWRQGDSQNLRAAFLKHFFCMWFFRTHEASFLRAQATPTSVPEHGEGPLKFFLQSC